MDAVSTTVFARDRRAPELHVTEDGIVHLVTEMTLDLTADDDTSREQPYGAECGRLVLGCIIVTTPVDCFECIAGRAKVSSWFEAVRLAGESIRR